MRFKVGQKVRVKVVYSGGSFEAGDIVTIRQIGCEDDKDCYGAISPHDGLMWYLCEGEVAPVTNADRIRAISDEELAELLLCQPFCDFSCGKNTRCDECVEKWLQQPCSDG